MKAKTIQCDLTALLRNVKDKGREIIRPFMHIQQVTTTLNTKRQLREEDVT